MTGAKPVVNADCSHNDGVGANKVGDAGEDGSCGSAVLSDWRSTVLVASFVVCSW